MYSKYEALRNKANVTDYEVAKSTGIAQATLSAWKHGVYTPKAEKLLKIAKYFGVSIESLIGEE